MAVLDLVLKIAPAGRDEHNGLHRLRPLEKHMTDQSDLREALGPAPDQATDIAVLLRQIGQIAASVPPAEWEKLPKDLAAKHDTYLYGLRRAE
jgi:hypothetical protein